MTPEAFRDSLSASRPPDDLHGPLRALWWDRKGDWDRAHAVVAEDGTAAGAWVHAYLHRREGDLANARYWYGRANQPVAQGPLASEWDDILSGLLSA